MKLTTVALWSSPWKHWWGRVQVTEGDWHEEVAVITVGKAFNTEDEARAWAEAQKPRVEAAWAALTEGPPCPH